MARALDTVSIGRQIEFWNFLGLAPSIMASSEARASLCETLTTADLDRSSMVVFLLSVLFVGLSRVLLFPSLRAFAERFFYAHRA